MFRHFSTINIKLPKQSWHLYKRPWTNTTKKIQPSICSLYFFLFVSLIVSVQVHRFPLNMCNIIIYVFRWWDKYLSKRSLIKHTCSWYDKPIILWTLNRQVKIFFADVTRYNLDTTRNLRETINYTGHYRNVNYSKYKYKGIH